MNWMSCVILAYLSFHGLVNRDGKFNVRLAITFTAINVYALHRVCLWLFKTVKYSNPEYYLFHIFTLVNVFNVAYWVNESFFRGQIADHCSKMLTLSSNASPLMDFYQVSILLLRVAGFVFQVVIPFTFDEASMDSYQTDFFYEIRYSNKNLKYFVIVLNKGILFYATLILGHFLQALLMYSIESLRSKVFQLAQDLSDSSVDEITAKHTSLFAEIRKTDALLKWTLFLWLVEWIGAVYDLLMCFAIENSGLRNYRFIPQLYNFISVFSLFVLFFEISLLSGSTSLLLKAFHLRFRQIEDGVRPPFGEVFLQEKIRTAALYFTVFETVVIDQSSMATLILGVLSYGTYIFSVFSLKNSSLIFYCPDSNYTLNYTNIIAGNV